jgi:hypothetical protein
MRRADGVIALLLAALGGYVLYETRAYPPSMVEGAPGPAAFPRLLAGASLVLAGVLFVRARRASAPPAEGMTGEEVRRNGVALLLMAAFLVLAPRLDFLLLLALLVGAMMVLMGERRAGVVVGASLALAAFVYLVFQRVFGVAFPTVLS